VEKFLNINGVLSSILKISYPIVFYISVIAFVSCDKKKNENLSTGIKGTWYLNKWTVYRTLRFTDSTVFVDNHVDTVFTLNYAIKDQTLTTSSDFIDQSFSNKIVKLTKDTLILDGFIDVKEQLVYARERKD
jgi:hypothetical protein